MSHDPLFRDHQALSRAEDRWLEEPSSMSEDFSDSCNQGYHECDWERPGDCKCDCHWGEGDPNPLREAAIDAAASEVDGE